MTVHGIYSQIRNKIPTTLNHFLMLLAITYISLKAQKRWPLLEWQYLTLKIKRYQLKTFCN